MPLNVKKKVIPSDANTDELKVESLNVSKSGMLSIKFSQDLLILPIDIFNSTTSSSRALTESKNYDIAEVLDIWVKDVDYFKNSEDIDKSIKDYYLSKVENDTMSVQLLFGDMSQISPELTD